MLFSLRTILSGFSLRLKISFPSSACAFFSSFIEDLIIDLALDVTTKSNQFFEGLIFSEVITSIWSPLESSWLNGTNFPFTFTPLHFKPISVCIEKAKSNAEAPFGHFWLTTKYERRMLGPTKYERGLLGGGRRRATYDDPEITGIYFRIWTETTRLY